MQLFSTSLYCTSKARVLTIQWQVLNVTSYAIITPTYLEITSRIWGVITLLPGWYATMPYIGTKVCTSGIPYK